MEIVKYKPTLKAIGKKFNLDFCSIYGYYEGNAYNDNKGNSLPHYMFHNGRIFGLKYISGCFNPFLVEYPINKFALIFKEGSKDIERVVLVDSELANKTYSEKYGIRFSKL